MEQHEALEQELADWCGQPHVVACASGTAALHLALEALQLPQGSGVLIPEFTMIACPRACTLAGLRPVPVDCRDDLLINPDLLAAKVQAMTRAIMAVHVYGRRCDMERIASFAGRRGFKVVEDMAEAHGVQPHPGSAAVCWSFYRNKIVAGVEGGAVGFRDQNLAERARELRNLGFTADHDFRHIARGHNYRMSDLHAAIIRKSLARADEALARRREVEGWYDEEVPSHWRQPRRDVCWVYDLRVPGCNIDFVVKDLNRNGVAARHGFKPVSFQDEYLAPWKHLRAYAACLEVLYLPVVEGMTKCRVRKNVAALLRSVERSKHTEGENYASVD